MIATAGLLTFAWSTGILVTLAQEFQDQRLKWIQQRNAQEYRLADESYARARIEGGAPASSSSTAPVSNLISGG
jgi:hypothetical protein